MFLGEYLYSIDDKKRLAIPVKFRKELKSDPIVTRGFDGCLFLFPSKEWPAFAKKISAMPLGQADARAIARRMLGGAAQVKIDKLGRILLPDYLKKAAKLSKKVILAGLYNRIEIWDAMTWERYKNKTEKEAENTAERLKELWL